jgi:hypothetical protein
MLEGRRDIKIIETSTASPSKQNFPRNSILDKEIPRVKFKENIIVTREFFNGQEIASNGRHVENIF